MINPLYPLIDKLKRWQPLGDGDCRAILALPYERKVVHAHDYIVRDGDLASHGFLILEGFAYRQKITGNGGRQILSLQLAGDFVDLQNSLLERADHSVQAVGRVEGASVPREAILDLAFARPAVGKALWYDTLVDASIAREWTTNIGQRDARGRLAHLMCEFALRLEAAGLGDRSNYNLPLNQEQLADATGLTPVHLNRSLRWFDQEGIIERRNRSVQIMDWGSLARIGDFDAAYLHLHNRVADVPAVKQTPSEAVAVLA